MQARRAYHRAPVASFKRHPAAIDRHQHQRQQRLDDGRTGGLAADALRRHPDLAAHAAVLLPRGDGDRRDPLAVDDALLVRYAQEQQQMNELDAVQRELRVEARQWTPAERRTGALAIKKGMMSWWDQWGRQWPVTVLQVRD